jgi:dinuclear metal center YbgI/SA1388 family protein
MSKVADIISAMEKRYPSASAELWDAVGLVTGNPNNDVDTVLFTVDPTEVVLDQAKELGAQMIVAHHPLILKGVSSVAESTRKGQIISHLIKADIALFTIHTNADVATPGVSDALAKTLGVEVDGPIEQVTMLGRMGNLPRAMTLADFAAQVLDALPKTSRGINVAGDLACRISRVAVCGGAGDSLLELVGKLDADVYVTSDLRYHLTEEFVNSTGKALIDISHWAGEWTWLDQAAKLLSQDLGGTLKTHVSGIVTDPWTLSIK